jgi:hypothetical protein
MIKTFLKHFIFDQCINVAFNRITENFIKPDPNIAKIQEYMNRIQKQFPEYEFKNIQIVKFPPTRYAETSELLGEGKYYRTIKFGDLENKFSS